MLPISNACYFIGLAVIGLAVIGLAVEIDPKIKFKWIKIFIEGITGSCENTIPTSV